LSRCDQDSKIYQFFQKKVQTLLIFLIIF